MAVIYSLTRGAWVGLGVAMLVFWAYRLPNWKLSVALVLLLAFYSSETDLQQRTTMLYMDYGTLESSAAIRVAIWEKALGMLSQSPVFGYGQQGTGVILGDVETDLEVVTGVAAHNDYIDMAVRAGFPALLMYFFLAVTLFAFGARAAHGRYKDLRVAYVVAGLMGALGYAFFHELLRQPICASLFWYLVGALAREQACSCSEIRGQMRGSRHFSLARSSLSRSACG